MLALIPFSKRAPYLSLILFNLNLLLNLGGTAHAVNPLSLTNRFTVTAQVTTEWEEYYGLVDSRTQVDVIARVAGRVKLIHARAGSQVGKGDLLLELESDEFQAKLQVAQSQLASAKANLNRATLEHGRVSNLVAREAAIERDLDAATAGWKSAQAAYEGAEAEVRNALTQLSYTAIRSPIDGVVADKNVNPGDFVMPALSSSSGSGMPSGPVLVTLYGPDKLWLEARIPERLSRHVGPGTRVKVAIDAVGLSKEGVFAEVVPWVDGTSRAVIARVDLPPMRDLKPGMVGRVRFASGTRSVIEIPIRALVDRGELDTVFVDANGVAVMRLVRCGRQNENTVEVLSGLTAGERVILDPAENLRDGDRL